MFPTMLSFMQYVRRLIDENKNAWILRKNTEESIQMLLNHGEASLSQQEMSPAPQDQQLIVII